MKAVWVGGFKNPVANLNEVEVNILRYRSSINVKLNEEQISYEEELKRTEAEVAHFVALIQNTFGVTCEVKQRKPEYRDINWRHRALTLDTKDKVLKLYAVDYVLQITSLFKIVSQNNIIGRLGIVCQIDTNRETIIAFDKEGLLYEFKNHVDSINVGDIIVFKITRELDSNKFVLCPQFISIPEIIHKGYGGKDYIHYGYAIDIHSSLFPYCFHVNNYEERSLLEYFFFKRKMETNLYSDFQNEFDTLLQYIKQLDINGIIDTYEVYVSERKVGNKYYQVHYTTKYSLETDDAYIRSLFVLENESRTYEVDWEDLSSLKDYRDIDFENEAKTKALTNYSLFDHLSFLLNEKMKEEAKYNQLVEKYKENWPLSYFIKQLKCQHDDIFIRNHNQSILAPLGLELL